MPSGSEPPWIGAPVKLITQVRPSPAGVDQARVMPAPAPLRPVTLNGAVPSATCWSNVIVRPPIMLRWALPSLTAQACITGGVRKLIVPGVPPDRAEGAQLIASLP